MRPDGEVRWLSTRTFPIRDAETRISRLLDYESKEELLATNLARGVYLDPDDFERMT